MIKIDSPRRRKLYIFLFVAFILGLIAGCSILGAWISSDVSEIAGGPIWTCFPVELGLGRRCLV